LRAELGPYCVPAPPGGAAGRGAAAAAAASSTSPSSTSHATSYATSHATSAEQIASYVEAMGDFVFEHADLLGEACAQRHHYAGQAGQTSDLLSALRRSMMRESRQLAGGQLPLHPDSAIYVRQDEAKMNVWRALLTGPVDTPYSNGIFVFDIFCPPEYASSSRLTYDLGEVHL
jgi:hypothetical protein